MASSCSPNPHGPVAGLVPVTRAGGGQRWLVTLTPEASRGYSAATLQATAIIERRLGPAVVANRIHAGRPEPWRRARARWRRDLAAAVREGSAAAAFKGDVSDCYGSIAPGLVGRRLLASGADADAVRAVITFLHACADQGMRGLPVGPHASGILANVVLAVVDDHLRSAGLRHRRWVDDVVVAAPTMAGATAAHDAFRRALDELGLLPSPAKTHVLTDPMDVASLAAGWKISTAGAGAVG